MVKPQTAHTPGPWTVVRDSTSLKRWMVRSDGDRAWGLVATLRGPSSYPEVEANAVLISQAPAMLEALKLAKVRLEGGNAAERAFNAGIVNVLNNVITQAEGKE